MQDLISSTKGLFRNNKTSWVRYGDLMDRRNGFVSDKSAENVAILIVKIFLDLLFKDMVRKNVVFHFPVPGTIKMRIAEKPNAGVNYKYDIKTNGRVAQPWLVLGHNFLKRCSGFYYYFNFSERFKILLNEETEKGHIYPVGRVQEEKLNDRVDMGVCDKIFDERGGSDISQFIDSPEMYERL